MMEKHKTAKTLIVLGSGGHTAEMVEIIKSLDRNKYSPRFYILAKSDTTSRDKITEIESNSINHSFIEIFRSRKVKQSYFTSIFTTLLAIFTCIPVIWRIKPDLVLCNGPGTCVPVCLIAYIFKIIHVIPKCKIVFVESFCRIKSISLSGKIIKYFADLIVVQWPGLENHNSKFKYYGRLI